MRKLISLGIKNKKNLAVPFAANVDSQFQLHNN